MSATKSEKKSSNDQDSVSSLLDMSQSSVKKMMAQAKTRGYISYDELNEFMPPEQVSSGCIFLGWHGNKSITTFLKAFL